MEGALGKAGTAERKKMIDRPHDLPLARQAHVVGISRGTMCFPPKPIGDADLRLIRHLDELHLELPFAGSLMLR